MGHGSSTGRNRGAPRSSGGSVGGVVSEGMSAVQMSSTISKLDMGTSKHAFVAACKECPKIQKWTGSSGKYIDELCELMWSHIVFQQAGYGAPCTIEGMKKFVFESPPGQWNDEKKAEILSYFQETPDKNVCL